MPPIAKNSNPSSHYETITRFFDAARTGEPVVTPAPTETAILDDSLWLSVASLVTTPHLPHLPDTHTSDLHIHTCFCNCSCHNICFCKSIYCNVISTVSVPIVFDPGISHAFPAELDLDYKRDVNLDYLFTGTTIETPYIPISHTTYYTSQYMIQIIDIHRSALSLIHKLHVSFGHLAYKTVLKRFKSGDFDSNHIVLTHPNIVHIRLHLRDMSHYRFQCAHCLASSLPKKHMPASPSSEVYMNQPFTNGYMDFYGPIRVKGVGGYHYCLFYISSRGRIGAVRMLKAKDIDEILPAIQAWRLEARDTGWTFERLHCDADTSFLSKAFVDAINDLGVSLQPAAGGDHFKIGLVERFISIVVGDAKSILLSSGLPAKFWPHAITHAVFLYNLRQNSHLRNDPLYRNKSPFEVQFGHKFRFPVPIFGQLCYSVVPPQATEGFAKFFKAKGRRCAFLGFEPSADMRHPVSILLNIETGKIIRCNDYRVVKNRYAYSLKPIYSSDFVITAGDSIPSDNHDVNELFVPQNHLHITNIYTPIHSHSEFSEALREFYYSPTPMNHLETPYISSSKIGIMNVSHHSSHFDTISIRHITIDEKDMLLNLLPDEKLFHSECLCFGLKIEYRVVSGRMERIPWNFKEAQLPIFGNLWDIPTALEVANIVDNGCISAPILEADLPPGSLVAGNRMHYDIKTTQSGDLDKRKARWIIQGFTQTFGENYLDTYCPTPFKESFRTLMYYVAALGWKKHLFDIKFAFLNAAIDNDKLFTELPSYFPGYIPTLRQFVRILKAIYGTKQAARLWHQLITSILRDLGYVPEIADPCAYNHFDDTGQLDAKCVVHIDDMPWVALNDSEFLRVADHLTSHGLLITESSDWQKILGVLIGEDINNNLILYNDTQIHGLIVELGLEGKLKSYSLPHIPNHYYEPNTDYVAHPELHKRYRVLIGSLLWIAIQWRFDILFITNHLSRFVSNPSVEHWDAALHVLGYLQKCPRDGLLFKRPLLIVPHTPTLLLHYDANWGGDKDCRSVSSFAFSLHSPTDIQCGLQSGILPTHNLITFESYRQHSHIADSTEAAETCCLNDASKTNEWLRDKFHESKCIQSTPTVAAGDNQATTINALDGKITSKNKHYARKLYRLRMDGHYGRLAPFKIQSIQNFSNMGTKPEVQSIFQHNKSQTMGTARILSKS